MDKLAKYPLLPILAGILSVFISFRLAAHRVPWSDLGVPILVAVTWSLIIWAVLYYTPYIRRLTKSEAGMAGAAIVVVTMAWMDFPSSLFATSTAWVLLIVITMSKPS